MRQNKIVANQKQVVWNTRKKMGWEKYKDMTENSNEFNKASSMEESPNKILNVIEKESEKIKHICFGKVKLSSKGKKDKKLEELHKKKMKIDDIEEAQVREKELEEVDAKIVEMMTEIQKENYEKEINNLEEVRKEKGKSAAIFKFHEK